MKPKAFRLVAFDLDGTLVTDVSSWGRLHERFGTWEGALLNLKAWDAGEISYEEFMRRDIALWPPRLPLSVIEEELSQCSMFPEAREVARELRRRGYELAIISGGIDILADRVARELGINHSLANGLAVDGEGRLTGEGIFRVDPVDKHLTLKDLAERLGFSRADSVAVGDGRYDVNFLKHAGLGVALGGNHQLTEIADVAISNLKELLAILPEIPRAKPTRGRVRS